MGKSAAFLDLGYTQSDQPRRPRGASSIPVHHPKEAADRSPAAAALRAMRSKLDQSRGQLTGGARAGDDPFARRQLLDAYERLKSALAVYNTFAVDLGVPPARVAFGDTELTFEVAPRDDSPVATPIHPAVPSAEPKGAPTPPDDYSAASLASIEAARAAFFARGVA